MTFPRITATIDPPGPHARAMLLDAVKRAGEAVNAATERRCWCYGDEPICACISKQRDERARVERKRAREAQAMERAMTVDQLLADTKASLLVLRTMHNVPITDAQIEERANNLVTGLVGNFRIERMDP